MYCNKCGKEIESGMLCSECEMLEKQSNEPKIEKEAPIAEPIVEPIAEPIVEPVVEPIVEPVVEPIAEPIIAAAAATPANAIYNNAPNLSTEAFPEPHNRMFGFGKALTSTILSGVGFFFVYIALIISATELPDVSLVFLFLSTPLIILPMIFGISSIKLFMARKSVCAKPIPTLVLGIEGLATSAVSAFLHFITLIISLAML